MPGVHEVGMTEAMNSAASGTKNIAATVTGVVVVGTTGLRLFRNVPDEHVGVIKHLGRGKRIKDTPEIKLFGSTLREAHKAGETYGIKPAGSRRVIPLIQSMVLVSTGINNQDLGHFEFDNADGDQMATEAWMNWRVMPGEDYAWRSIYRVSKPEELGQRLRAHALGHLSYVLSNMKANEMRNTSEIQNTVRELSTPLFEYHGTEFSSLDMRAPVYTSAQKQLFGTELQASATLLQAQNLGRIAQYLETPGVSLPQQRDATGV